MKKQKNNNSKYIIIPVDFFKAMTDAIAKLKTLMNMNNSNWNAIEKATKDTDKIYIQALNFLSSSDFENIIEKLAPVLTIKDIENKFGLKRSLIYNLTLKGTGPTQADYPNRKLKYFETDKFLKWLLSRYEEKNEI